ncbi:hypothetical protein [Dehalobacter sp. TeCB1]|uniref:hypothetical protein n=1 Tax=Dehalobacter sp. TeCB1 TaxID=1843715 RepID=UPI00083A5113|nr:hypothetical protein [Dehalobacter sp. TeCB1]OCZ54326.1 hypothetical protein A7D23_06035 [Dehalobacter sp. TeCB1]
MDNLEEITGVMSLMAGELIDANEKYPLFASAHEGYGVMAEEFQELFDEIRKKKPDYKAMHDEAIQLGAMCMKFILSMEGWV